MDAKTMIGVKYVVLGLGGFVVVVFILGTAFGIEGTAAPAGAAVAPMACMVMFAAAEGYRAGQKSASDRRT